MSAGKKYANNPLSILCKLCIDALNINNKSCNGIGNFFFFFFLLFFFSILFLWFRSLYIFSFSSLPISLVKQSYDLSNACMMIKITRKEHQSVYSNVPCCCVMNLLMIKKKVKFQFILEWFSSSDILRNIFVWNCVYGYTWLG